MAGIPLLNGFLSKEMMLEEANSHGSVSTSPWLVPCLATVGSLFSAAYCFRLIGHVFLGPVRDDYPAKPHDPNAGLWLPPAILVVLVVVIGVAPFLAEPFVKLVTASVLGDAATCPKAHFKIWHGLVPALFMSIAAVVGGLFMLAVFKPALRFGTPRRAPKPSPSLKRRGSSGQLGASVILPLHNGAFSRYAAIGTVAIVALGIMLGAQERSARRPVKCKPRTCPIRGMADVGGRDVWHGHYASQPSSVAHSDRHRGPDGLDRVCLLQRARSGDDAVHCRGGHDHPVAVGAQFLAQQDTVESSCLTPRARTRVAIVGWYRGLWLSYHYLLRDAVRADLEISTSPIPTKVAAARTWST